MRVFLCVSLVITKVSAGPSFFSASIIAAEVGPRLHKSGRWLCTLFTQGLKPQVWHVLTSTLTVTRCSGLCTAAPFALRRSTDLNVCPPTLFLPPPVACFAALVIYSTHAEWQPASRSKTLAPMWVMRICVHADVIISITSCCLLRDTAHISLCSKVTRSAVILPDSMYFRFQLLVQYAFLNVFQEMQTGLCGCLNPKMH